MKKLELNQMENLQGGNLSNCVVAGIMAGVHLSVFGPWGFIGGFIGGCAISQL